jgi:hypothetical protein
LISPATATASAVPASPTAKKPREFANLTVRATTSYKGKDFQDEQDFQDSG